MKLKSLVLLFVVASLLVFSSLPALRIASAADYLTQLASRKYSSVWFDAFSGPTVYDGFDAPLDARWVTYRGNPTIVEAGGRPSVLKLTHPEPGDASGPFSSRVGTSLFLNNPATADFADGMIEFDLFFETSGWAGVNAMLTFRMQSEDSYYALRLTSTRDWHCSFMIYSGGDWKEIGWYIRDRVFPTGAWSHVTVVIGGQRMSCYQDGNLICFVEEWPPAWSQGHWGGVGFQNNYYSGVFYVDNFRIPGRMKWNSYRGSPRIDSNLGKSGSSMIFDHPSMFGDEASFGSMDSCSAYVSDLDLRFFQNGIIEFDMFFDNDVGQKAFMTFRMEGENSYYAARMTSTYDWSSYFVRRTGSDNWYTFGTSSGRASWAGYWSHVTIIIDGGHFEMWKDWTIIAQGDDWSMPRGMWGGIGFYSAYYGTSFHIDNLKICLQG